MIFCGILEEFVSHQLMQFTTEMTPEAVASAAKNFPANTPLFMLNLLRYRERADYGGRADMPSCSGREAYYAHYLAAFNQVAASEKIEGIEVFYLGAVAAQLVAPVDERWDDIVIVQYPDFAAFRRVVESPLYAEQADPHRSAALEDWRLIATTQVKL